MTNQTSTNDTSNGYGSARRAAAFALAGVMVALGGLAISDDRVSAAQSMLTAGDESPRGVAPLLDPVVYTSLTAEQQDAVDRLRERFGDVALEGADAPPVVDGDQALAARQLNPVASWFAQEVMSWGFGVGLDAGYDALAAAMGWGGQSPMGEVNAALAELESQYAAIQTQLQGLADSVVWNTFASAHFESQEEAGEVLEAARDIAAFETLGVTPSKSAVSIIATATRDALIDLGPTLITNGDAGSIPALIALETNSNPVGDGEAQWDRVLTAVETYRGVYAQGVMSMLWAAQFDATHGSSWGTFASARVEAANEKIAEVYDYVGAPYGQMTYGEKWVHENGADWALSSSSRSGYLDETPKMLTTESEAGHRLALLARTYREVDGVSLEQYLTDRDIATRVPLSDTFGWRIERKVYQGHPWFLYRWDAQLNGNSYTTHAVDYNSGHYEYSTSWLIDDILKPETAKKAAEAKANPLLAEIAIPTNPKTGMPARMDDESIRAIRDGLKDVAITRGTGDDVHLEFTNTGYDSLQVTFEGTDIVLMSIDLNDAHDLTRLPHSFDHRNGALEVRVGYQVEGDKYRQDTRATTVVAANPGSDRVNLDVTVRE